MLTDPFDSTWLDAFDDWAAAPNQGVSQYFLIDGAFVPGLYRKMRSRLSHDDVALLFETLPGCSDAVRDVSPFLVRYDVHALRALSAALLQCDGWPMVSAIATTENLTELTARLAAWCVVYADGQRFNLRFPDTRRLPGIFTALTPEQQGHFAGPATRWSYMSRYGVWSALQLTATGAPAAQLPPVLDHAQFSSMVQDSETDEMLAGLALRRRLPVRLHSQLYVTATRALRLADAGRILDAQRDDWCEACLAQEEWMDDVALANKLKNWQENFSA